HGVARVRGLEDVGLDRGDEGHRIVDLAPALDVADHGRPLDREAALAGRLDDRVEVAQRAVEIQAVAVLGDTLALELAEEILDRSRYFGVAAARRHRRRDQREGAGKSKE